MQLNCVQFYDLYENSEFFNEDQGSLTDVFKISTWNSYS